MHAHAKSGAWAQAQVQHAELGGVDTSCSDVDVAEA
jgi:hypothetical protein